MSAVQKGAQRVSADPVLASAVVITVNVQYVAVVLVWVQGLLLVCGVSDITFTHCSTPQPGNLLVYICAVVGTNGVRSTTRPGPHWGAPFPFQHSSREW